MTSEDTKRYTKKDIFVLTGLILAAYTVFSFGSLFIKDLFKLIF